MKEYRQLILVLGDIHIPNRINKIPNQIKNLFSQPVDTVICTGNYCNLQTQNYIKSLSKNHVFVRGNMDTYKYPQHQKIKIGNSKIGIINGYQIIPWINQQTFCGICQQLNVDILITGYTHSINAQYRNNKYFLNPGSLTGVYGPLGYQNNPSFIIIQNDENELTAYFYQLIQKNFRISKIKLIQRQS